MENIIRVGLYPRVSTDEQVQHGYSLGDQEDSLIKYANEHNMKIVGIYRDEGYSARKPAMKRPAMLKLLEDVKAGKIDRILFIKLDRWFRNVREYYRIQDILESNGVSWQATMENYETATTNGRLQVNIALSFAESESDRTSDRIKFVFDSRVQKREVPFPARCAPFGYTVKVIDGRRKLVKDESRREVTEFFFKRALETSIRNAGNEANMEYGLSRAYRQWHGMVVNPTFTGTYKGVTDFCEPYITEADFARLNGNQPVRKAKENRVYIFSGLLKCANCGRRMSGKYVTSGSGREYLYYRCIQKMMGLCDNRMLSEKKIEEYLLEHVREEMGQQIEAFEVSQATPKAKKTKSDAAKLQERLRRLNVSYQAGNMSDEDYLADAEKIKAAIAAAESAKKANAPQAVNVEVLQAFLGSGFESIYETLTQEERRRLWRSVVGEIVVKDGEIVSIKFL